MLNRSQNILIHYWLRIKRKNRAHDACTKQLQENMLWPCILGIHQKPTISWLKSTYNNTLFHLQFFTLFFSSFYLDKRNFLFKKKSWEFQRGDKHPLRLNETENNHKSNKKVTIMQHISETSKKITLYLECYTML